MKYPQLRIILLATSLAGASTMVAAEEEVPFSVGQLFFELNDTDGDLGIHGEVDGDEWKRLEIKDYRERRVLNIRAQGRLRRQGLTQLFFESAEPPLGDGPDELLPEVFFKRFPEGWYEIEGVTVDGEKRENEVYLSHVIPAAVDEVTVNGQPVADDCDAEVLPEVSSPVSVAWAPVTTAHADLGRDTGSPLTDHGINVVYYEIFVEIADTIFKAATIVPADVNSVLLPTSITDLIHLTDGGEFKFEILVRTDNGQTVDDDGLPIAPNPGNKSAVENCFVLLN